MNGKICLITGGGSGIGAAAARLFGAAGGRIIVSDINLSSAQSVSAEIPGSRAIGLDVSDPHEVNAVIDDILANEGRLDVLIHFAGVDDPEFKQSVLRNVESGTKEPIGSRLSDERWRRMIDINLSGTYYMLRATLEAMLPNKSGAIVTMASVAGIEAVTGYAHYSAAKAGVIALTRSLSKEYIHWGIRINTVAPDPVDTPMSQATPSALIPQLPIGRYATADEVAKAALFLASDDASYISGETLILAPGRLCS